MIHINNITHVLKYGITHRNSVNANTQYVPIGDVSLISNRTKREVQVDNGNLFWTGAYKIVLGNFIPFYFGVRMPMLYVIQNGGNFVEKTTPAADVIYLACKVSTILELDIQFYFSDGHATDKFTTFYDKSKIEELPYIIDWDSVRASYWGGSENLNTKRKKQAEFLTEYDLPANLIQGVVCYNEHAKSKLVGLGVDQKIIKIAPEAYY